MTLQNFVDQVGPVISANWLNFVDGLANSYAIGDNSGALNAYVLAIPATSSFTLSAGALVRFRISGANNTGAATLNVGGTGAKPVVNPVGQALTGGELRVTSYNWVEYDNLSDSWRLISIYPQISQDTFVPTLAGLTTPGSQTYTDRVGFYTLTGKEISFKIHILLSAKDAAAAGSAVITGLPIPAKSTSSLFQAVIVIWSGATLTANFTNVGGYIAPTETQIRLTSSSSAGNATAALTMAQLSGTAELIIAGHYFID